MQKLSDKSKICCPHCGKRTNSLKVFNMVTSRVCAFYYFETQTNPLIGCPKCITQQNLWRTFNNNIIKSNFAWPVLNFPIALITLLRSYVPGHSRYVHDILSYYNQTEANEYAKIYHNWTGIPGFIPPFSLLKKVYTAKANAIAKRNHSFVWAIKAMCYMTGTTFLTSLNGRAIAANDTTVSSGLVAFDSGNDSFLFFRDLIVCHSEVSHLRKSIEERLSKFSDEFTYASDTDNEGNRHYHVKCLYKIDFNNKLADQMIWVEERMRGYQNELLRWYNNAKLSNKEDTIIM